MNGIPSHELGRRGEELAADFFIQKGYAIVVRNWRCPQGELDLVIRKEDEVRIIEVKTRRRHVRHLAPYDAVTDVKLDAIGEAAAHFFAAHPTLPPYAHLDVLSIILPRSGTPVFQWLQDFE